LLYFFIILITVFTLKKITDFFRQGLLEVLGGRQQIGMREQFIAGTFEFFFSHPKLCSKTDHQIPVLPGFRETPPPVLQKVSPVNQIPLFF
jgi:hypothetical protein